MVYTKYSAHIAMRIHTKVRSEKAIAQALLQVWGDHSMCIPITSAQQPIDVYSNHLMDIAALQQPTCKLLVSRWTNSRSLEQPPVSRGLGYPNLSGWKGRGWLDSLGAQHLRLRQTHTSVRTYGSRYVDCTIQRLPSVSPTVCDLF